MERFKTWLPAILFGVLGLLSLWMTASVLDDLHDVTGYDVFGIDAFVIKVACSHERRRAMQCRRKANDAAIELLRKRRVEVASTKAGFHMHERNFPIERRERGNGDARCIALRNNKIRLDLSDHVIESCQHLRAH